VSCAGAVCPSARASCTTILPARSAHPATRCEEGYQAPPVSIPPPPPARSHKRQESSSPVAASPLPQAEPPSPVQSPLHLQLTFPTHGWSLRPGHRNSRALATSTELKSWEEKRGGFYQHDTHRSLVCPHLDELRVLLPSSSEVLDPSVLYHTGSQSLCSSCCGTWRLLRSLHISLLPFSEAQSSSYHAAFGSLFGTQKQTRPSNAADQLNCQLALSWLRASQLMVAFHLHPFCLPSKSSSSTTKYDLSLKPAKVDSSYPITLRTTLVAS